MRIILSETLTTSNTLSHLSSARRIPTPPVPVISRPKHFEARVFSNYCFTPSFFHLVSWRQHKSTPLRDTVSTTSLAFFRIMPTLSVPARNVFRHSLDSPLGPNPAAPHPSCKAGDATDYSMVAGSASAFSFILTCHVYCSKVLWQDALPFTNLDTLRLSKTSAVPYWLGLCAPQLAP